MGLAPLLAAALLLLLLLPSGVPAEGDHPPAPDFENPWEPFYNLSGCHLGENRAGLADLKSYLHRFGYLPESAGGSGSGYSDDFDDSFESALLLYQRSFRLNATGALDAPTVDLMVQPRCGVPDVVNGTSTMDSHLHGRGLYSYFPGNPSWPRDQRRLTYFLSPSPSISVPAATQRKIFARAFARWAEVTTLSFVEAGSADAADIVIGFHSGAHGDGEPFDGKLGTLAHAFSPTDGRFHLDAAEEWVGDEGDAAAAALTAGSAAAVDLESVAVHEIGHLLGLGHSAVEGAIMYPTIRTGTRKVQLADDDVKGIQSLYGNNPKFNGSSTFAAGGSNTMPEGATDGGGSAAAAVGTGWVLSAAASLAGALLLAH